MTSEAYVWVWLPEAAEPVVCGRLYDDNGFIRFVYGRSYRARDEAIALDPHTLHLGAGPIASPMPERLPGAMADAAPDNCAKTGSDCTIRVSTPSKQHRKIPV